MAVAEIDAVHRMALHLSRNPDEANDLVQETYLRAFRGEGTFTLGDRGIRPWLFKILHNTFFTRKDRAKREPLLSDDLGNAPTSAGGSPGSGGAGGNGEPAWDLASLNWEQVDDRLKHAIDELPEHYRAVLLLWAVEGLKYREIADVLDVPLGTIMSRLFRTRAILSEKLSGLAAEHGIGADKAV
jgi:RNA polymerase sigma-70 factor (ECF subfamily)